MTEALIPDDFPHRYEGGIVPGGQSKLCCVRVGDIYVTGETSSERRERWSICDDLARQLVPIAMRDAARHPDKSADEVLARVGAAVERKNWVSPEELAWLLRRLRVLIGW